MQRRSFLMTGAAAVIAGSAKVSFAADIASTVSNPVVETTTGKIRGFVHDRINGFKGIPYAA